MLHFIKMNKMKAKPDWNTMMSFLDIIGSDIRNMQAEKPQLRWVREVLRVTTQVKDRESIIII